MFSLKNLTPISFLKINIQNHKKKISFINYSTINIPYKSIAERLETFLKTQIDKSNNKILFKKSKQGESSLPVKLVEYLSLSLDMLSCRYD